MTDTINKSIICVDDEEAVLESYKKFLAPEEDQFDSVFSELFERGNTEKDENGNIYEYNLFLANSGERAVEIVKKELDAGNRIVAGFFDMRMPGGIDGYETMEIIKGFDPDMYCAVVTAYTDRRVDQVRKLFPEGHRDELLYFQKPFTGLELQQTAYNMVQSWNRKRNVQNYIEVINKNRAGLEYILKSLHDLAVLPPRTLEQLIAAILCEFYAMLDAAGAYLVLLDITGKYHMSTAIGCFETADLEKLFYEDPALNRCIRYQECVGDNRLHILPLTFGQRTLGAICLDCTMPDNVDVELLNLFSIQVAPLLLNSIFYEEMILKENEVMTDPLTGLYNRRVIMKWFATDLLLSEKKPYPLSVIMIDVDSFKNINDTYGHNAGDQVLRELGEILNKAVRACDIVRHNVEEAIKRGSYAIRYGGEEFMVILTHTDSAGASILGERIREQIASHSVLVDGDELQVTASLGVSSTIVDPKTEQKNIIEDVIANADQALYSSKAKGKNRLVRYEDVS